MYKITLLTLLVLSSAAPYEWYRNFFVGVYTGFVGEPGQLFYNCLNEDSQSKYSADLLKISTDWDANDSIFAAVKDILVVGDDMWSVYDNCKVWAVPDALLGSILKDGPLFLFKFIMNLEPIVSNIWGTYENYESDPMTAGTFFGKMFLQFLTPNDDPKFISA
jgi:hypothetical protein